MFTRSDPIGSPERPAVGVILQRISLQDGHREWIRLGANLGAMRGWAGPRSSVLVCLNVDVHICNKICEPFVRYDMCMLIMLYIARLYFIGISWDSKLPTQII
jgi:hypothetical protein